MIKTNVSKISRIDSKIEPKVVPEIDTKIEEISQKKIKTDTLKVAGQKRNKKYRGIRVRLLNVWDHCGITTNFQKKCTLYLACPVYKHPSSIDV